MEYTSLALSYVSFYRLFAPEYRRRWVTNILARRNGMGVGARGRLDAALNRVLRIKGFRHPAKAPEAKLAEEIMRHMFCCRGVLESMLDAWVASNGSLYERVQSYLAAAGAGAKTPFEVEGGEVVGWSEDMRHTISSAGAAIREYEEEDVALMICCVEGERNERPVDEVFDSIIAGREDGAAKADVECADGESAGGPAGEPECKSHRLKAWLGELVALPADAEEWGEIYLFTRAVEELAAAKLEQQAAGEELRLNLDALIAEHGEELIYFGVRGCESWPDRVPAGGGAALSAAVKRLRALFEGHARLRKQISTTVTEAREHRTSVADLEDQIIRLLDEVGSALAPKAPEQSGDQKPGADELSRGGGDEPPPPEASDVVGAVAEQNTTVLAGQGDEAKNAVEESKGDSENETALEAAGTNEPAAEPAHPTASGTEAVHGADETHAATTDGAPDGATAEGELLEPAEDGPNPTLIAQETVKDNGGAWLPPPTPQEPPPYPPDVEDPAESHSAEEVAEESANHFGPEQTAAEIASAILAGGVNDRSVALRDLIWRLVLDGCLDVAFNLSKSLAAGSPISQPRPATWLLRAMLLARNVCNPNGDVVTLLREDFAEFSEETISSGERVADHAMTLLCAAAAMRPAILAPSTNSSAILHRLRMMQGLPSLYECWQIIAKYGDRRRPAKPIELKGIGDMAVWDSELDRLRQQARGWLERAPHLQVNFSRAAHVWRRWQQNGQLVHTLLMPVLQNDIKRLSEVMSLLERLSDDSEIKREIDLIDQSAGKRRTGKDIVGGPLIFLRNHLQTAMGFAHRWIELQEARPGRSRTSDQLQSELLSREMRNLQKDIRAEIAAYGAESHPLFIRAAIAACRCSLEDLWTLFDSETSISTQESEPKHILYAELLKLPTVQLNDLWEPCGKEDVTEALLKVLAEGRSDWLTAFEFRSAQSDHLTTGWILEYLETQPGDQNAAAELRQTRERRIEECRNALALELKATREDVEGAVALGLLMEKEHLDIAADISGIEATIPQAIRFDESFGLLRECREKIKHKRDEGVEAVKQRLSDVGISVNHPAYERIINVLEGGDISTAYEYIDLTLQRRELPSGETSINTFINFFPEIYRELDRLLGPPHAASAPNLAEVIRGMRAYADGQIESYSIGPISMRRVEGKQAERAAEMLEAWLSVKEGRSIDRLRARKILVNLGFTPLDLDLNERAGRTWIALTAEPISNRIRCPLPVFGSSRHGRYRILCVWDMPSAGNLLNYVGDTSHGPIIVLYFGSMTEQTRYDVARLCRQHRSTFIVIDDTLMLYLCSAPEPRMLTMFECALPFTFVEPYTTTASLVPIEMFYGREEERRLIMDPMGSCFIYGGRQLGKTALLRDVERRFNDESGKVALWFDIKARGIGRDNKFDDIWRFLAEELQTRGVPFGTARQMTIDKFEESIVHWLEEDRARSLLLLLDEADEFLLYDGKVNQSGKVQTGDFMRASRLKGLMDRTDRRFKVVFAGLHNVQRTTRLANHPLAHYGNPICIGPLLDKGEWREAHELIERPLAALGHSFKSPDLVARILWQTNYYPSLIQLYCNYLLRHIINTQNAVNGDPDSVPPYFITSRQVEEAYLSHDLRKEIRDRMIWTLQLDERYEVIAYAIALDSISDKQRGMSEGLPVSWIRNEALVWWPSGFEGSDSDEAIRTLLDEMVGLGILRTVNESRYALRSTNVAYLMGTEDEITSVLLRSREPPLQYEAATFRAAFGSGNRPDEMFLRSPLTAEQESYLRSRSHGVSIIFGCRAGGLEDVEVRLKAIFGSNYFVNLDGTVDKMELENRLSKLGDREGHGTTAVFVPALCPWSAGWVFEAVKKLKKLKSKSSYVRVIFVADPVATWQLVSDETTKLEDLIDAGVTTLTLRPWHDAALRQWLDDLRFVSDRSMRDRIFSETGNWPALLRRFFEKDRAEVLLLNREMLQPLNNAAAPSPANDLIELWGLDNPEALLVFRYLSTGESTVEDLARSLGDAQPEVISKRLLWADHLGLATKLGDGYWRIDHAVSKFVNALQG